MNNQTLFIDCCGYAAMNLIESTNGSVKFRGKFQEANAINKNKRTYPYDVLARNVDMLEEAIKSRGLYGELDHPTDSVIHLKEASHVVTKLWWEGNTLMGEADILPTPCGLILRKMIESGCRIGISSRGVGNGQTNNEGVLVIGESYKLITFDAVADPSTYQAFQKISTKSETFVPQVEHRRINPVNKQLGVSYFELELERQKQMIIENIRKK